MNLTPCRTENTVCCLYALLALLILGAIGPQSASANDSAAEIGPVGLQFKVQRGISIEKEELRIRTDLVEVYYRFRNNTSNDVVTEIAFPIPEYRWGMIGRWLTDFRDFALEVDGKKQDYHTEVKAFAEGEECTEILRKMHVSIAKLGKPWDYVDPKTGGNVDRFADIDRLTRDDIDKLKGLKVLEAPDDKDPYYVWPKWSVSIKYHWTQRFPAGKSVIIKHSFSPYYGFQQFCASKGDDVDFLLKSACINEEFVSWMEENGIMDTDCIEGSWVSYILTTANNWHGPIKDFRLIVEKRDDQEVATCFEPRLTSVGTNRYETSIKNFVPKNDLRVYFFKPLNGF